MERSQEIGDALTTSTSEYLELMLIWPAYVLEDPGEMISLP